MKNIIIVIITVIVCTVTWLALKQGNTAVTDSSEMNQEGKSSTNSTANRSSRPAKRKENEQIRSLRERYERSTEEQKKLIRSEGFLFPDEVDPKVHTRIGSNRYTKKVDIDDDLFEKILTEIGEGELAHENREKGDRDARQESVKGIILELADIQDKEKRHKVIEKSPVASFIDKQNGAYAVLDNAALEISGIADREQQHVIAKKRSHDVPLKKKEPTPALTVSQAYETSVARSSYPIYFPRYYETEDYYHFFREGNPTRGRSVRKRDSLVIKWKLNDE